MPAPEPLLPSSPITTRGDRRRRQRTAFGVLGGVLAVGAVVATVTVASGEPDPTSGAGPSASRTSTPPTETTTGSAGPASLVSIPDGFPLAAGYPDENEDRSPVTVTDRPGFKQVELCGTTFWDPSTPSAPADLAGTSTTNPEDFRARTLALYPDEATAASALQSITDGYNACTTEDIGNTDQYYRVLADEDDTLVVAHTYGPAGGDNLGAEITQFVRVDNALFLDSLYGESGTSEQAISGFAQAAAEASAPVVDALEALMTGQADPGGSDGGTSAPGEEGTVPLDPQDLLMIEDLPATPDYATAWEEAKDTTYTWACRLQGFGDLGADSSLAVRYQALASDSGNPPTLRAHDAVLQFATPEAARAAYHQAVDYLQSCTDNEGFTTDGEPIESSLDTGDSSYLQGFVYAATDTCTDCDAAWFDYMGVTQNGARLVLVSYAQVGGPLAPEQTRQHAQDVLTAAAGRSGL